MNAYLADAHTHLFPAGYRGSNGALTVTGKPEIEAYEAYRARYDIRAALVIGYEADGIDPDNNRYVRSLASSRPWMHTLGYVVADAADLPVIDALLSTGHMGIAVYVPDTEHAIRVAAWPAAVWTALDRAHAVVSFNARPEAIAILGPRLRTLGPNIRFVFSHLGLPGRYAEPPSRAEAETRIRGLLDIADLQNVLVKVSGLYAVSDPPRAWPHEAAQPFVAALLDRFGPDRCLWGSDFSPALEFVSFADTIDVSWLQGVGSDGLEKVMGGNLVRMLSRAEGAQ